MIVFCTWCSISLCHSGLAFLNLPLTSSQPQFLSLWISLCLFLSLSLVIYHSTGGLAWLSSLFCLDDSEGQWQSGALAGTQRVWICIFPLGVLSSDVKRGYVIYVWLKGVSTAESQSLKERGLYCVCVCTWPVEFYTTKRVKTTHCVCFSVSSWLSPQGCAFPSNRARGGCWSSLQSFSLNFFFLHISAEQQWSRAAVTTRKWMSHGRRMISLERRTASRQTFLTVSANQIPVSQSQVPMQGYTLRIRWPCCVLLLGEALGPWAIEAF